MSRRLRSVGLSPGRTGRIGLPLLAAGALALGIMRPVPAAVPVVRAATHGPFGALLARSQDLGQLSPSTRVSFLATLHPPSSPAPDAGLSAMYNPRATTFQHYWTGRQWAQRSAPLSPGVAAVRAFLAPAGLSASWRPGSEWIEISGAARAVGRVFHVAIHSYISVSGRRFYASAHDPAIPPALSRIVSGAGHISSYPDRSVSVVPVTGLRPGDMLSAYDLKPLRARHLTGKGMTIVFIEIDGYKQADLNAFTQHFHLPAMHPTLAAGVPFAKVQGEAELDLEIAHEIAPGANLKVYNCFNCSNSGLVQLESQAVQDNPRSIISISLGGCETAAGATEARAENNVFSQADALGESVLVSSGDSGAYTCLMQDWGADPTPKYVGVSIPSSYPTVTAVGGTSLDLHSDSSWYREQVWQNPGATSGSGGGISAYFARPSWQSGPGVINSYSTSGRREVPDISADADPLTGAQVVIEGEVQQVGGTSQAAPIWAGMVALIDQYLRQQGHPVAGFLNPALYELAAGNPAYPPFHDVTQGNNLVYPATPGYDLATGLGTPDAWNLARDLAAIARKQQ